MVKGAGCKGLGFRVSFSVAAASAASPYSNVAYTWVRVHGSDLGIRVWGSGVKTYH